MLHCVCLSFALLGGGEDLKITNPRTTYGYMGATHDKKGHFPGDSIYFAFDLANLTPNKEGQMDFSLLVEVFDPAKELVYSQGPRNHLVQNYFGGNSIPCHAEMSLPIGAEPGIYSVRVSVVDKVSGKKASFSGKGHVLPPDFGIVRVGTFGEGRAPRSPVGVVGELLQVKFSLMHFKRDDKKMTDVEVSMRILDDKKAPLKAKPQTNRLREVVAEKDFLPLQFGLTLDRPGSFFLEISAKDNLTGKTSQIHLPVRALEPQ